MQTLISNANLNDSNIKKITHNNNKKNIEIKNVKN